MSKDREFRARIGLLEAAVRALREDVDAIDGGGSGSDLTAAEVKTLYESNADTNEFSDAEEAIVAAADPTGVTAGWVFTADGADGAGWAAVGGGGARRRYLRVGSDLVATSATITNEFEPATFWATNVFVQTPASDASAYSWVSAMPNNWDGGDVRLRVYWLASDVDTGAVKFDFAATASVGDGEALPVTTVTSTNLLDNGTGVVGLHVTDWATLSPSGWADGKLQAFWFRRHGTHASDTYAGNATLLGVEMEWEVDGLTEA